MLQQNPKVLLTKWSRIILLATAIFLPVVPNAEGFAGGSGSENDPFLVATAQHLDNARNHLQAHFRQTADINLDTSPWNTGEGWQPIGAGIFDGFTGVYDGNGHLVTGLSIKRAADAQGLFGYIMDGGVVKNLGVAGASVNGGAWYVGALAGRVMGGRIEACFSSGTVAGQDRQVGGLIGRMEDRNEVPSVVVNSYSLCAVSGLDRVGGLVGKVVMGGSRVIHAYSAGPVTGTGTYVGALAGRNGASSQEPVSLYWVLETSGHGSDSHANPKTLAQMRKFTTFLWWDFKGESINGTEGVWNIGHGRNNGMPYLAWQYPADPGIVAAFAGGGGTEEDPFLIATPDDLALVNFQYLNNDDVWFALTDDIDLGVSPFADGEGWVPVGTNQNRQVFTPLEDSRYFSGHFDGRGHAVSNLLINRPNQSYQGFFGIVRGATIQNIELRDVDITGGVRYLGGLAGRVYATAISGVGVTGAVRGAGTLFISPTGTHGGGLAGYVLDGSSVTGCRAEVDVSGYSDIGGLIGTLEDSLLSESWASGWSRSRSGNGGLVGRVSGDSEIRNSHSRGRVSTRDADIYLGGLVGINLGGSVRDSYSTALVYYERAANPTNKGFCGWVDSAGLARMSGNYWDMETSGQTFSACNAQGKTTAALTHPHGPDVYVGWDFDAVWAIDTTGANDGYPILRVFAEPNDRFSRFSATVRELGPGNTLILRWTSAPGRVYAIEQSSDLWGWSEVVDSGGQPLRIEASPDGNATEVSISFDSMNTALFFRVVALAP